MGSPLNHISQPPHSAGTRFLGPKAAIDLSQVPSAVDTYLADQTIWSSELFLTCETERTIPLSVSEFNAVDQGESLVKFLIAVSHT